MEKIRKEIHLSPATVKALAKIAAAAGKTPKRYVEDLIIEETRSQMGKINSNHKTNQDT